MRATTGDLNSTTHSDQFKTVGKPAVFYFVNFYRCARKAIISQCLNKIKRNINKIIMKLL